MLDSGCRATPTPEQRIDVSFVFFFFLLFFSVLSLSREARARVCSYGPAKSFSSGSSSLPRKFVSRFSMGKIKVFLASISDETNRDEPR